MSHLKPVPDENSLMAVPNTPANRRLLSKLITKAPELYFPTTSVLDAFECETVGQVAAIFALQKELER